ncbi:hypothetical protein A3K73_07540 [Candidatus Pacearchaeota archaeon RBG_13_36_9]|nr:MAG: hypothetical protein A3K73_07540 [Candidatus Pacearchaeota archaeon RBG_13_36_9]
MWNVNIYLQNGGKTPKTRTETKQRELSESKSLEASILLRQLERQEQLSKLNVKGALDRLEESLTILETGTDEAKLNELGREIDLNSREAVGYLTLVIGFSNDFGCDKGYLDWIKINYDRATKLIHNANQVFKKYSGWPFDFFSKCAKGRLNMLEYAAKTCQPVLLGRSALLKGH